MEMQDFHVREYNPNFHILRPHSDHVWGDSQFDGRPDTTMIKPDREHLKTFFGFTKWPEETRILDVADRLLDVILIPGRTIRLRSTIERRGSC